MDFYSVISPIHFVSKLCGITIFSITKKSRRATIRKTDIVFIILSIVMTTLIIKRFFWKSYISFASRYQSPIITNSLPILLYGKFVMNIVCIVWGILGRQKIAEIIETIQSFDKMVVGETLNMFIWKVMRDLQMESVNIRFNYRKLRICLHFYLVFIFSLEVFLVIVSCFVQNYYGKPMDLLSYMLMFWGVNTMSMSLSQTILLILSIRQRFAALNHLLETTSSTIRDQQLKIVSQIHLKLTEAIELMNETYCMMFMLTLAGAFGMFNLFLFTVKSLLVTFNSEMLIVFAGRVLINFYAFVLIFLVILVANSTTNEANRTIRILFDTLHNLEKNSKWRSEMKNFVNQITLSQTRFSCGLFSYDWKLCFKVKTFS